MAITFIETLVKNVQLTEDYSVGIIAKIKDGRNAKENVNEKYCVEERLEVMANGSYRKPD